MNSDGFTLIEIIVVVIILGVLATLAVPRLMGQQESACVSEAVQDLTNYYGAYQRFALEHTAVCPKADCSDLDVAVIPKNYHLLTCSPDQGVPPCTITAKRSDDTYKISVDTSDPTKATFTCTDLINSPCAALTQYLPK